MVEKLFGASVTGELATPVPEEAVGNAARSRASIASSSGVEGADIVASPAHILELQVEHKNLFARHAGNQTNQMDMMLNLCYEKK